MKNKFPKLSDALFQDEQLSKNALGSVVGGGEGDTYRTTYEQLNTYDSSHRLKDSKTTPDEEKYDARC